MGERPSKERRRWKSHRRGGKALDPAELPGAHRGPLPELVAPQLPTLVTTPPAGDRWLHEIKHDGYRVMVRIEAGAAKLLTRQGHDWTGRFGRLAEAVAALPAESALLDGEVVALRPDGTSDFQALQQALGRSGGRALHLMAFDLLHLEGYDLQRVPLVERKGLLQKLIEETPDLPGFVRYGHHLRGEGGELFRQACELGAEGVISKRAEAPYRPGRSRGWLKIKCGQRQELVVVGFTDPEGSRQGFGALLLAYHDEEGRLRHAGRVGTGFDRAALARLRRRLEPLERRESPLGRSPRMGSKGVHWVEPRLVVEVAFGEWTDEGNLRHASFVGVREDTAPGEVRRERARATRAVTGRDPAAGRTEHRGGSMANREKITDRGSRGPRVRRARGAGVEIAGVRLTNPERVLYPGLGITKRQLAEYYAAVAHVMLPELARRPLSLLRCPSGRSGECFYQKHFAEGAPETLIPVEIEERSGKRQTYVSVGSAAGLVTLAQLGVLEIHPWGSRAEHLERPDRWVFDLDPGPGVDWREVVAAARELRALLRRLDLESFPKLTGGKGIHLVVPVVPELDWDQAKRVTRAVARLLESESSRAFTTNPSKARRRGKIFIDYLRNGFGATAVAGYSPRARPRAPVAVPIRWDELGPRLAPDRYRLTNVRRRLAALGEDPWSGMAALEQRLQPRGLAEVQRKG